MRDTSGGKAGFVLHRRPRRYEETQPQRVFREAADTCGIRKGITKAELQQAMLCVKEFYRQRREESNARDA